MRVFVILDFKFRCSKRHFIISYGVEISIKRCTCNILDKPFIRKLSIFHQVINALKKTFIVFKIRRDWRLEALRKPMLILELRSTIKMQNKQLLDFFSVCWNCFIQKSLISSASCKHRYKTNICSFVKVALDFSHPHM